MTSILYGTMVLAQSRWLSFNEKSADVSASITSFGGSTRVYQSLGASLSPIPPAPSIFPNLHLTDGASGPEHGVSLI